MTALELVPEPYPGITTLANFSKMRMGLLKIFPFWLLNSWASRMFSMSSYGNSMETQTSVSYWSTTTTSGQNGLLSTISKKLGEPILLVENGKMGRILTIRMSGKKRKNPSKPWFSLMMNSVKNGESWAILMDTNSDILEKFVSKIRSVLVLRTFFVLVSTNSWGLSTRLRISLKTDASSSLSGTRWMRIKRCFLLARVSTNSLQTNLVCST